MILLPAFMLFVDFSHYMPENCVVMYVIHKVGSYPVYIYEIWNTTFFTHTWSMIYLMYSCADRQV